MLIYGEQCIRFYILQIRDRSYYLIQHPTEIKKTRNSLLVRFGWKIILAPPCVSPYCLEPKFICFPFKQREQVLLKGVSLVALRMFSPWVPRVLGTSQRGQSLGTLCAATAVGRCVLQVWMTFFFFFFFPVPGPRTYSRNYVASGGWVTDNVAFPFEQMHVKMYAVVNLARINQVV